MERDTTRANRTLFQRETDLDDKEKIEPGEPRRSSTPGNKVLPRL